MRIFYEIKAADKISHTGIVWELELLRKDYMKKNGCEFEYKVKPDGFMRNCGKIKIKTNMYKNKLLISIGETLGANVDLRW